MSSISPLLNYVVESKNRSEFLIKKVSIYATSETGIRYSCGSLILVRQFYDIRLIRTYLYTLTQPQAASI
jgi:hypothetical protein